MNHLDLLMQRYPCLEEQRGAIESACKAIIASYEQGGKVLVCGNGGSCADAEHIVGELMKGFCHQRPLPEAVKEKLKAKGPLGQALAEQLQSALPAISLCGHSALSTAFANDVNPDFIFAQQALGYARPGDVFIGISTSGNANNVLAAGTAAKVQQATTIALTGKSGGAMAEQFDIAIAVPAVETYQAQELHLPVYHTICLVVESHFFPNEGTVTA